MTRENLENVAEVAARLAQAPHYHSDFGGADGAGSKLAPVPPHVAAREAVSLVRLARRFHRLCERACDDPSLTEREHERIDYQLRQKADAIAARFGLHVYYQTDPRGWPLVLSHEPLDGRNYDRGWRITPHAVVSGTGRE